MGTGDLGLEPADLGLGLRDPLGQDRLLIGQRRAPARQAIDLARQHPRQGRVAAAAATSSSGKATIGRAGLLGQEPRLGWR